MVRAGPGTHPPVPGRAWAGPKNRATCRATGLWAACSSIGAGMHEVRCGMAGVESVKTTPLQSGAHMAEEMVQTSARLSKWQAGPPCKRPVSRTRVGGGGGGGTGHWAQTVGAVLRWVARKGEKRMGLEGWRSAQLGILFLLSFLFPFYLFLLLNSNLISNLNSVLVAHLYLD
jgi:hypothetical protein